MTTFSFASWAQPATGASEADIDPVDAPPVNLVTGQLIPPADPAARPSLAPVAVVTESVAGTSFDAAGAARIDVLGPEGIVGLEPGHITGRYPVPGSTGSEAINLAAIEFDSTDLPWRFSPARAGAANRLRPWLVLIVAPVSAGVVPGTPLPSITVPVHWLPDLAESWAWAHVQSEGDATTAGRSRLLCPLKLPADTTLQAALVPAFHGGVQAGLGQPVDAAAAHAPAWTITQADDVTLPVYDYWQFATGKDADFEFLARRIRPVSQDALGSFGYRSIDINGAWPPTPFCPPPAVIAMGGALRPLGTAPAGATDAQLTAFATRICDQINATANGALGPPLRGGHHAQRATINAAGGDWLDQVNRDPAQRIAAARGADWVQANQEQLMAKAWTQAGQIREAARRLALARASIAITETLHAKHVAALNTDELIALTTPAAGRARLDADVTQPTLQAALAASVAPTGLISTAMARLVRPAGALGRATQARTVVTRAVSGALPQAVPTGYSLSKLAAIAQTQPAAPAAPPAPAPAHNPAAPVKFGSLAAAVKLASLASASRLVTPGVAQAQAAVISSNFTKVLNIAPPGVAAPPQLGAAGKVTLTSAAVRTALSKVIAQAHVVGAAPPAPPVPAAAPAPAAPAAPNPVTIRDTAAAVEATSVAATSLWVASRVAQTQGVAISSSFTTVFNGAPQFIDGPATLGNSLSSAEVRTKLALAIARDQLTVNLATAAAPPAVTIDPDGLRLSAPATTTVVTSAFDAIGAVRKRLLTTVLRAGSELPTLDPVLQTADVPVPMATALLERGPEWLLPGIGAFPVDRANLLTTDDAFVESVLLGANVELLGEFLWREFPTDRRGTPIGRFWPRTDGKSDIAQIHTWSADLGTHTTIKSADTTILLVRAELFVRYPNTVVLAARAEHDPTHPGQLRPVAGPDGWHAPLFTIPVDDATRAIGFPVPKEQVLTSVKVDPGWFFVMVEPPTSIRFGFDLRAPDAGPLTAPASWNDLTWDHVIDARGFANARTVVTLNPVLAPPNPQWGGNPACSADVARIALQHPVRVALHASTMIPGAG